MRDRIDIPDASDQDIRVAFAALPLRSPTASAWPQLERDLRARRATQHATWPRWAALAAGLALVALLPLALKREAATVPAVAPVESVVAVDPNAELIERNQAVGAWLLANGEPFDAQSAQLSAEIEDMIGMIDVELSGASEPSRTQALWQQRLLLLNELASVRSGGVMRIADSGSGEPVFQDTSYRID